jgi:hypothetical protein
LEVRSRSHGRRVTVDFTTRDSHVARELTTDLLAVDAAPQRNRNRFPFRP